MRKKRFKIEFAFAAVMLMSGGCFPFVQRKNPAESGNETILQLVQQKTIQDTIGIWKEGKTPAVKDFSCEELEIKYLKQCVNRKPDVKPKPEVIERYHWQEEDDIG